MRRSVVCALLAAGAACEPAVRRPSASQTPGTPADSTAVHVSPAPPPLTPPPPAATRVATIAGFLAPESVLHDTAQDIYFVSNINGSPTAKDDNGFISRVRPDGAVENLKFIEGGHNGVTLHAPKGLALLGDSSRAATTVSRFTPRRGWRCWGIRSGWPTSTSCARSTPEPGPLATV